jgi:hypothetical protein
VHVPVLNGFATGARHAEGWLWLGTGFSTAQSRADESRKMFSKQQKGCDRRARTGLGVNRACYAHSFGTARAR